MIISRFPKNPWGTFHVENKFTKKTRFFFEQFSKNPWYFPLNFFPKIMGFSLHIFQKPMEFFHEKHFSKNSWDFSRKSPFPRVYLIKKHLQKSMELFCPFKIKLLFKILWTFHLFEINFLLQNKLLFLKITMEFPLFVNWFSKIIFPSKYIQRNNFHKPKILVFQNAKKINKIFFL